jgi:hypothetical protein
MRAMDGEMMEQLDLIKYILSLEEKELITLYRMDEVTSSGVVLHWPEWYDKMWDSYEPG